MLKIAVLVFADQNFPGTKPLRMIQIINGFYTQKSKTSWGKNYNIFPLIFRLFIHELKARRQTNVALI